MLQAFSGSFDCALAFARAALRISPVGSRYAHAAKPAQLATPKRNVLNTMDAQLDARAHEAP